MMRQAGVANTSSPKDRIFSRQRDRFRFAFPGKWMYVYLCWPFSYLNMYPLLWKHDNLSCTFQIWSIRQVKGFASPRIQIIKTAQAHIHILMRLYHIHGNLSGNVWFSQVLMYVALVLVTKNLCYMYHGSSNSQIHKNNSRWATTICVHFMWLVWKYYMNCICYVFLVSVTIMNNKRNKNENTPFEAYVADLWHNVC